MNLIFLRTFESGRFLDVDDKKGEKSFKELSWNRGVLALLHQLVVSTPLKNSSQIGNLPPNRDEHKKYLKPPPRWALYLEVYIHIYIYICTHDRWVFYCTYITISAYITHSSKAESLEHMHKLNMWLSTTCSFGLGGQPKQLNHSRFAHLLFYVWKKVMNAWQFNQKKQRKQQIQTGCVMNPSANPGQNDNSITLSRVNESSNSI